jgi:hypothetical protein
LSGNNRYNSEIGYYNSVHYKNRKKILLKKIMIQFMMIKNLQAAVIGILTLMALLHDLYEEKLIWDDRKNVKFQELQLKYYEEALVL